MSRDSGDNVAVDFVWGNFPLQPNDDRDAYLSLAGSHAVAAIEWDSYPNNDNPEGGHLLNEGDPTIYWPNFWAICGGYELRSLPKLENVINTLVDDYGMDRNTFVDFTFSGGANKWDWQGGEANWDGAIFYLHLDPYEIQDWDSNGVPIYGWQLDGRVFGSDPNPGTEVYTSPQYKDDAAIYVFSTDPLKDTLSWWWW